MRWLQCVLVGLFVCLSFSVNAQTYKRLPPDGIELTTSEKQELAASVAQIDGSITALSKSANDKAWQNDVLVLRRSLKLAIDQNLFFGKKKQAISQFQTVANLARRRIELAREGKRGLDLLGHGKASSSEPQLLVGGFVSAIDDSVQPFGLIVPAGYDPNEDRSYRLDVWLHGRGDTKTEVPFLVERMTKKGYYTPEDTFVLHPFGRHCNAFKFAGETDVYESIEHVCKLINVDRDRISIRGFSMGGAGVWHLAVHDPTMWFAANPGAGFVDTIEYQGWDKNGMPFELTDSRKKLLGWYDVRPWVNNLRNTNMVAYSGEVDKQRKAADQLVAAAKSNGFEFPYVIGEGMGHKIDPPSVEKIDATIDRWAAKPVSSPRESIDFTTYTLKYNRAGWLSVLGLEEHFRASRVQGKITGETSFEIKTDGVTRLKIDFAKSPWPKRLVNPTLTIDGQTLTIEDWSKEPGVQCELVREDDWKVVEVIDNSVRKRPGLQGPIDDAFTSRFVFVVPSRPARHGVVQRWIDREIDYAKSRWARLMRGTVNVVRDSEVTPELIENCNLVCFGDFRSNLYLAGIASQLPIKWTDETLEVGTQTFDPDVHAVAMCFPNPQNPKKYLVVNSGMTFREFSNVSNSRQIAMLPDWAVMKVDQEEDGIFAGDVVADGFFDEAWELSREP